MRHSAIQRAACAATLVLAFGVAATPAAATPSSFTDASFLTVAAGSAVQFTFLGVSAADTDQLSFDGQAIFTNQTASVGQVVTTGPLAAGTYMLSLANLSMGTTYSSNPALNPDGAHLAFTSSFADFNLGAPPPGATGLFYGWEDRPLANSGTLDFNDLVFAVAVLPPPRPVPEPATLLLVAMGLLGTATITRRRAR